MADNAEPSPHFARLAMPSAQSSRRGLAGSLSHLLRKAKAAFCRLSKARLNRPTEKVPDKFEPALDLGPHKFVPRDAGFFSNFNHLVGEIYLGRRVYPLYNIDQVRTRTPEPKHFAYFDRAVPNSWFEFFEPIAYSEDDDLHRNADVVVALPTSFGVDASSEFRDPAATLALYASPEFPGWRRSVNEALGTRIIAVPKIRQAIDGVLKRMKGRRIGVHVRHPSHMVEQGEVFFKDYFERIDQICYDNPHTSIFLAADNELAIAVFRHRYGDRVRYHEDFIRQSVDDVMQWAYALTLGSVDQMGFVNGRGFQTHYRIAASGGGIDGLRAGQEAVTDAFTLAGCDDLVCTLSNFTLTCAYLNPNQAQHLIAPRWRISTEINTNRGKF